MTYTRVIPRDLFNEASLLKMMGQFWLMTEGRDEIKIIHDDLSGVRGEGRPFEIEMDRSDGSIYVANLRVFIKKRRYHLYRPLNSREAWPLWIRRSSFEDFEPFLVFQTMSDDHDVALSEEMRQLIGFYDDIEKD